MKLCWSTTLLAAGLMAVGQTTEQEASLLETQFRVWMDSHGKNYVSNDELLIRREIWMDNHKFIEQHNNQQPAPSYILGHNQFSDMTTEEYAEYNKLGAFSPGMVTGRKNPAVVDTRQRQRQRRRAMEDPLPTEVDWVAAGAVVPVKNQGMCGSCWAFSAICAIEGAHFLDTGSLVGLSEQELVDCDPLDMGCGGGLMDNAFLFDEDSPGICSEEDYPYKGHRSWLAGCAAKKGECDGVEHTRVSSFIDVPNTVDDLMDAIADQPVSVAIEADQRTFQLYRSGVYNDPECGNNLDHGVAAVGYGTSEDGQDYFVVRNSWGESWGDSGYIKMSRLSDNVNGTCGILSVASRPILRDD